MVVLRGLSADVPIWYLATFNTAAIGYAATYGAVINVAFGEVTSPLVIEAHQAGVPVVCWTVPNASYNAVRALGVDLIMSDTLPPKLDRQSIAYGVNTDDGWDAFSTTGTLSGGVVALTSGQTVTLIAAVPSVPVCGHYFSFEAKGPLTITANGIWATVTNATGEFQSFAFASLLSGTIALTITATGAASVKNISARAARF